MTPVSTIRPSSSRSLTGARAALQVIAPGAKEHAASLIEHMVSRKQQLGERAAALVTCRRARAAMTADELLNVDGKLYAVSRAAAFAAAAGAGGDDDDRDDGGGSVWTGATYVWCSCPALRG
jgi:hypothetical protein